jgi:hypothetical protein
MGDKHNYFSGIKNLQHQDTNSIDYSGKKNSLCCTVTMSIYVDSKQNGIGKQREGADRGNSFIVGNKEIKEFSKRE